MKKIFIWTLLATTFAIGSAFASEAAAMPVTDAMMMPDTNNKTYKFDTKAVTALLSGTHTELQEITCPRDSILQTLWLLGTLGANRKWTNLTYEDTVVNMFVTYDLIGCNFNAYANNMEYQNLKPITENKALEYAKAFMENAPFKDVIKSSLGEPIIVAKYNNNGPMPYVQDADSKQAASNDEDYIDTPTYTNISILFPYIINGKKVYYNYGGRAGISVEVTEKWVTSYNGQFIVLPGAWKKAKVMTPEQTIKFVKRGGNNPYYGQKRTVQLNAPERVMVIVNDWKNGKNTLYLASGTRFGSNVAWDDYNPTNLYEMIIVDYGFANPNLNPVPMYR